MKQVSNFEIYEDHCLISLNPQIYPLDVIYTTSYVFTDRAYVLIDGEPNEEIIVELKPKTKEDLEILAREFNNELLNYVSYKEHKNKNEEVRKTILQRVLLTNDINYDEDISDPEGVATPWEENQEDE